LWNVTPCSLVDRRQHFGVMCYFILQGVRVARYLPSQLKIILTSHKPPRCNIHSPQSATCFFTCIREALICTGIAEGVLLHYGVYLFNDTFLLSSENHMPEEYEAF
jgi:hypothetical protein